MKIKNYRGFELEARRKKCLAGYSLVYFYALRLEDGLFMEDSFSDSDDTIKDHLKFLKHRVDLYHERIKNGTQEDDDF